MEVFVIGLVAFIASCLTFFSGFGLGTLLFPVFALFFPLEVAVALTAVVHFLNNLFKVSLVGKYANMPVILKFGIPAILMSFLGAYILIVLSKIPPLMTYELLGALRVVSLVKIVLAFLMVFFAVVEFLPLKFGRNYLFFGGLFSGFFGGLSGHQGAFRSAFLTKCGLSKESFIGTGVVIAVLVDFSRISIYAIFLSNSVLKDNIFVLVFATLSAFVGAYVGSKLLVKVTLRSVQWFVSLFLILIAVGLGIGLI